MARQCMRATGKVHRQLEAVGPFHGPSRQLVQSGQNGIDARQSVGLGLTQRREPQGRQISLQWPQVVLSQRQVMQQVQGAGSVVRWDLFEFLGPGTCQRDLMVAELGQGLDRSGGFFRGESARHGEWFQAGRG